MSLMRAKVVNADYERVGFSADWATAWRGMVHFDPDRLSIGGHEVPYAEIEDAVLVDFPGVAVRTGYVLAFRHSGVPYQIGLDTPPFADAQPPFPLERREQDAESSRTVSLVRMRLAGFVVLSMIVFVVLAVGLFLAAQTIIG